MNENEAAVNDAGKQFPFVSLDKALGRARQLFDAAGEHDVLITDAFEVWKYSLKSSGGHQTIGALKMYGILGGSGSYGGRKLVLTEDALRYFRDERKEVHIELRRKFALSPKLVRSLWKEWGASPPADNIARSHLKIDRKLSEQATRSLLGIYKENLSFAELTGNDMMVGSEDEDGDGNNGSKDVAPPPLLKPKIPEQRPGMNQDIFTLEEGAVVFQWPAKLSQESYDDLEGWTALMLRKIKRSIVSEDDAADANKSNTKD